MVPYRNQHAGSFKEALWMGCEGMIIMLGTEVIKTQLILRLHASFTVCYRMCCLKMVLFLI